MQSKKNNQNWLYISVFIGFGLVNGSSSNTNFTIKQVVIWGHKLHTHTHSYVHFALHRAFSYLGYATYWFDDQDALGEFDFAHTLFLTEGQVDKNIPLRSDCRYILHNCSHEKYRDLIDQGNCVKWQVYTKEVNSYSHLDKLADYIFFDQNAKVLYMPWATDLMPYEIDAMKQRIKSVEKKNIVHYVGSKYSGNFSNDKQLDAFAQACQENNIEFTLTDNRISFEDSINLIQSSIMVPALQSAWQVETGYITPRIFQIISYGQVGITNSKTVAELFNGKIVYHEDAYQLGQLALTYIKHASVDQIHDVMDFVKNNHTYLNRILWLLDCFHRAQK
jgi:hypothetical protein